jgi:hypothetical protein
MLAIYYFTFSIWLPIVYSKITPDSARCVTSIYSAYGDLTFASVGSSSYYEALCQNPLEVISIYAASTVYCQHSDLQAGITYLSNRCEQYGGIQLLPWSDLSTNLTQLAIDQMKVIDYGEVPAAEVLNVSVLISKSYFDLTFETEVSLQPS